MNADLLTGIGTIVLACGTLALAIIAIFRDHILAWFKRPKLNVTIYLASPDCYLLPMGRDKIPAYYFMFRVVNSGNKRAEEVEVVASELLEEAVDGSFVKRDSFSPMRLNWAYIDVPLLRAIPQKMYWRCNLGYIRSANRQRFQFTLETEPFHGGHVIPPGRYRLIIFVVAANAKPQKKTLEIVFQGDWYKNPERMFSEGIRISVL